MPREYFVYILTNASRTVLYTGMTNDLKRRAFEHREGMVPGFTQKYHVKYLVYYEICGDVNQVILREKQIKGGSRKAKKDLINAFNPDWRDLYDET